jgi:hypothetical protein
MEADVMVKLEPSFKVGEVVPSPEAFRLGAAPGRLEYVADDDLAERLVVALLAAPVCFVAGFLVGMWVF